MRSESGLSDNEKVKTPLKNKDTQSKNVKAYESFLKEQTKKEKRDRKDKKKSEKDKSVRSRKKSNASSIVSLDIQNANGGLRRFKALGRKLSIYGQNSSLKGEVYPTLDSTEEDNDEPLRRLETHLNRSAFTIQPDGNFKSSWDLISSLLIIHWSLMIPL